MSQAMVNFIINIIIAYINCYFEAIQVIEAVIFDCFDKLEIYSKPSRINPKVPTNALSNYINLPNSSSTELFWSNGEDKRLFI